MKFLVLLYILALSTACVPQGLPTAEPSPTLIAPQPISTLFPTRTATPTLLLPTPTPMFSYGIRNLAIGEQGQLYAELLTGSHSVIMSWDGAKWIALGNGSYSQGISLAVDSAGHLYADAELLTGYQPIAIMKWDGVKWEDITSNFSIVVDALKAGRLSANIPLIGLALDGEDNLYAAGYFDYPDRTHESAMGYVAKWDQDTWTILGQGFDHVRIYALAASASGKVYVSGEPGFIAEWDGERWTQIGTSELSPCSSITELAVDKTGGLYTICASGLYWDGTDWITIPSEFDGTVYAMAVDRNDHLCVGGEFSSVNGIPARNIACWDGSSWHALGDGVNERVIALAFDPNGELYAVGFFTEAGGLPVDHAARWDGEMWHALGQ